MFKIVDTQTGKTVGSNQLRTNAERVAQRLNIKDCGVDEIDKPENERRYIIK